MSSLKEVQTAPHAVNLCPLATALHERLEIQFKLARIAENHVIEALHKVNLVLAVLENSPLSSVEAVGLQLVQDNLVEVYQFFEGITAPRAGLPVRALEAFQKKSVRHLDIAGQRLLGAQEALLPYVNIECEQGSTAEQISYNSWEINADVSLAYKLSRLVSAFDANHVELLQFTGRDIDRVIAGVLGDYDDASAAIYKVLNYFERYGREAMLPITEFFKPQFLLGHYPRWSSEFIDLCLSKEVLVQSGSQFLKLQPKGLALWEVMRNHWERNLHSTEFNVSEREVVVGALTHDGSLREIFTTLLNGPFKENLSNPIDADLVNSFAKGNANYILAKLIGLGLPQKAGDSLVVGHLGVIAAINLKIQTPALSHENEALVSHSNGVVEGLDEAQARAEVATIHEISNVNPKTVAGLVLLLTKISPKQVYLRRKEIEEIFGSHDKGEQKIRAWTAQGLVHKVRFGYYALPWRIPELKGVNFRQDQERIFIPKQISEMPSLSNKRLPPVDGVPEMLSKAARAERDALALLRAQEKLLADEAVQKVLIGITGTIPRTALANTISALCGKELSWVLDLIQKLYDFKWLTWKNLSQLGDIDEASTVVFLSHEGLRARAQVVKNLPPPSPLGVIEALRTQKAEDRLST
jgi:hypothetical protein